ncbi:MAG: helix-turn-helix domain-containing protein [Planctomycetota bacterium]|nr:helix-turn-helix domain-containing protein [Planctomycetota bacterium]
MPEFDAFEVPAQAIAAFERLHGLRITVHDLHGSLWRVLPHERFQHVQSFCQAVKAYDHDRRCMDFEHRQLRRDLSKYPHGRVHACFAGFVEWVAPVFRGSELEWVLFAGLRTPGPKLADLVRDTGAPLEARPWPARDPLPRPVDDEEAAAILEALRQLAARLRLWELEYAAEPEPRRRDAARADELARRATLIRHFIQQRFKRPVRLADLARRLNLSESRAGHAVKEACGATFVELLAEARLSTAAGLLRHTELPILEVARRSGFGDPSHFHRAFRSKYGLPPLQYRKRVPS